MLYFHLDCHINVQSVKRRILSCLRQEEEKDHMFEGMRKEHETQIEELRQQVVTAIGNEKLKRDAER